MKYPMATDFEVLVHESTVNVLFKPTESRYSYLVFADGSISPHQVRDAKTGDTENYAFTDIENMAYRLACVAIHYHRRQ
jgi:hypothetical protein